MLGSLPRWIVLSCARTPATIASAKRLELAAQQEMSCNNTDGAIPTIYAPTGNYRCHVKIGPPNFGHDIKLCSAALSSLKATGKTTTEVGIVHGGESTCPVVA